MIATPVLVVGGGPVGLTTALELAYHGVPSVVVEPRVTVDHLRPRAKTTSARSMELFRRTGVADEIRRRAAIPVDWSAEIRFCTTVSGAEITRLTGTLGLELVGSPLTSEAAQQVTQPVVEEALRAVIEREPLVTMLFGWRASAAALDGVRPSVTIEDPLGNSDIVECDYLIGADGSRSVVREALGAHYLGAPGGRPNVNITFRSTQLAGLLHDRPAVHHWVLNPAAPGVVGPLDLTGTWWAIATGTASISDDAEAVALVRGLVGDDVDVDVIATDPWQARLLLSDSYGRQRTYLVGDAAHQNPPWGGHGYNTGVGDAVNLAWKIAAVTQEWAPVELLDSYEAERRPVARQTIDLAAANMRALPTELGDAAMMSPGPDGETARAAAATVIPVVKRSEFYSRGLVLGYGYGPAAAAQAPSTDVYRPQVQPGNRLPHARSADGSSLFDLLGREFTVLGPAPEAQLLIEAAVELGVPISHADPQTHGFAPVDEQNLVLVRPDQHIAWVGHPSDWSTDPQKDPRAIIGSAICGFAPRSSETNA
jgi:2-polyprenyl-6-methoxyphenol hydroxylase-like FAD-dependent oxidoreductase